MPALFTFLTCDCCAGTGEDGGGRCPTCGGTGLAALVVAEPYEHSASVVALATRAPVRRTETRAHA